MLCDIIASFANILIQIKLVFFSFLFFFKGLSSSLLQVTNVDDEGNELGSGIMELTQTELILHTRKRDAIRWPYLCLRRYGYDSNLFSFESGRRCQTGQGKLILPLFSL